jgi:hypothetical protein
MISQRFVNASTDANRGEKWENRAGIKAREKFAINASSKFISNSVYWSERPALHIFKAAT